MVVWLIVIATLLGSALRIGSYGYVPFGDGRRHIAMAIADKSYADVLVLRPGYFMTNSPGWEWLLRLLHRRLGWDADTLSSFALLGLLAWVLCSPLPWLRRPEAWLAALLGAMLARPTLMHNRFAQGRPYLLTEGILIAILFAWSRIDRPQLQSADTAPRSDAPRFPGSEEPSPSWLKLALTWLGFTLSVWIHGLWYMWALPLIAFFLAGRWRSALWLTGCWLAGTTAGALLTGHPIGFLRQALFIASSVSSDPAQQWMLVGELAPHLGDFPSLLLIAVVFLCRKKLPPVASRFCSSPAFWLVALAWLLGFKANRFWSDWGIPAMLVWLTLQFEEILELLWSSQALKRLASCGLVALPCFLVASNDPDGSYTANLREPLLDAEAPALRGWLPDAGGIFYNSDMRFFYDTFYENPQAPWRYVLGLEPALMPEDDLRTYRIIQFNHGAAKAYEPWIKKMRPIDRLAIYADSKPDLPQLQWTNAVAEIWLGRLPR